MRIQHDFNDIGCCFWKSKYMTTYLKIIALQSNKNGLEKMNVDKSKPQQF